MTTAARTERIELRAQPVHARRIRQAAQMRGQTVSAFMLQAANMEAEAVLATAVTTPVPAAFFEGLWKALSASPKPNARLAKRAAKSRRFVQR